MDSIGLVFFITVDAAIAFAFALAAALCHTVNTNRSIWTTCPGFNKI